MITHLILFRSQAALSEEEVRTSLAFVESLSNDLLEHLAFDIVANRRPGGIGFPYALVIRSSEQTLSAVFAHPAYQQLLAHLQEHYQDVASYEGDVDLTWPRKKRLKEKIAPEEWQKKSAEQRLKILLMEELDVPERELLPSASLVEDLNADSLDLVEIIMGMEEEFGIQIRDEEVEKIFTVGEALDLLREKGVR